MAAASEGDKTPIHSLIPQRTSGAPLLPLPSSPSPPLLHQHEFRPALPRPCITYAPVPPSRLRSHGRRDRRCDERCDGCSATRGAPAVHRRLALLPFTDAQRPREAPHKLTSDEREMRREPFSMPFSVSGELCMDRKAVRHALIMALETFTIDDQIYSELVKISVTEPTSLFYRCCMPALSRTTETRLLCACARSARPSRHAANRNTGAQTKPTLTIHSCTE